MIFFFLFELSGGYMSVCLVAHMFTIFHNNNKHHRKSMWRDPDISDWSRWFMVKVG